MVSEEPEEETALKAEAKTAPPDARFPNANVTYYCFQMYVDFHKCIQLFDPSHQPCTMFEDNYKSLCPNDWIRHWDDQREAGTFPVLLPNDCKKRKAKAPEHT